MQILFSYFAKNRFYPSRTTFIPSTFLLHSFYIPSTSFLYSVNILSTSISRIALFFVAVSVGNFIPLHTRRVGNYKPYRNFIGTL